MTKSNKFAKLTKVNESFIIYRYDNGFMVEVGGRNNEDDWRECKVLCSSKEELFKVIEEALALPKAE